VSLRGGQVGQDETQPHEVIACLREGLAGTEPGGECSGVAEAVILSGADERGLSDGLIGRAKKRLGVLVGKDHRWSLPSEPGKGPTFAGPHQELATNR
jgi:hypothetical protein